VDSFTKSVDYLSNNIQNWTEWQKAIW